ncbi:MAG: DMT family transporter, partial [Paracoccaceae bacterium]
HLTGEYPVAMVVMLRFWFFGAFAVALTARTPGGIKTAIQTRHPALQVLRGLLVVVQICISGRSFAQLGLIQTHAVMVCGPLLIAALSGPILGENVGWRRWVAIGIGGVGVLIILRPGTTVFTVWSLLPLAAAILWALYVLATRYVARDDSAATSFFWTGVAGGLGMTVPGLWYWQNMTNGDWGWMLLLCICSVTGHWLLIKVYDLAEASAVQPLTYLQLVFIAILGVTVYDEVLHPNVVIGAVLVVAAGLFTLWRQQVRARAAARQATI